MKPIYFITGNKGKFQEMKGIIDNLEMLPADLLELQEIDTRKIIEHKLAQAKNIGTFPCIVEDTSLSCEGLGGLPGPFVKWFLKALTLDAFFALVLSTGNVRVYSKTVMAYSDGKEDVFFEEIVEGTMVAPRGTSTFGWDPIFVPHGDTRTYGEMTTEEKNTYSTRGKAARKVRAALTG